MKPMPYEIVPPVEHMNPHGACFDMYQCPACLERMQLRDDSKHLSDAECAAHFHQSGKLRKVWELSEVLADEDYSKQINGNRHAEIIWRRFATTPHALGGPDGSAQ